MNLYILNNVLFEHRPGMCVIAAESKEQCRKLFDNKFGEERFYDTNFDDIDGECPMVEYTVIEGVNHPSGVVSFVYGGN